LMDQDAQKHPKYAEFIRLLGKTGASQYDRFCFIRWLAMAQAGGGWMSDYDVFPLHDFRKQGSFLPNDGVLTIHNRQCPSLVSGAASEWNRVAMHMIQFAAEHHIDTDQKTMAELSLFTPPVFEMDLSVSQKMLNVTKFTPETCRGEDPLLPKGIRAVHFAHSAIKRAIRASILPREFQSIEKRPEIVSRWMTQWTEACGADDEHKQQFEHDPQMLLSTLSRKRKLKRVREYADESLTPRQNEPPANNTWVSGGPFEGYVTFI